jgi:hypothetical protein
MLQHPKQPGPQQRQVLQQAWLRGQQRQGLRVWMRRNHAWEQQPVRVQGQVQVPQRVLLLGQRASAQLGQGLRSWAQPLAF